MAFPLAVLVLPISPLRRLSCISDALFPSVLQLRVLMYDKDSFLYTGQCNASVFHIWRLPALPSSTVTCSLPSPVTTNKQTMGPLGSNGCEVTQYPSTMFIATPPHSENFILYFNSNTASCIHTKPKHASLSCDIRATSSSGTAKCAAVVRSSQ